MRPTLTAQQFVEKWAPSQLKERSGSQEHFIDLCRLLGHPTPAEADPTGQTFTFEAGASKQRGGEGWADVWKRGYFAWEYKGKHKDLDAAYQQLLQYRESLQNPPLLVVSDMERIVIHTNFTNTVKRIVRIELEDLLTPDGWRSLGARTAPYMPAARRGGAIPHGCSMPLRSLLFHTHRRRMGTRRLQDRPQVSAHRDLLGDSTIW